MVYIPEEFKEVVVKHVYRNVIANIVDDFAVPLILVISGPTGVGKTYQVHHVLEELGVNIHEMSGTEFENGTVGVPAKELVKRYDQASEEFDKTKNPSVLLIDDADAVIGNWGELVQYTVNTQMLNKTFIDIADNPKKTMNLRGTEYGQLTLNKTSTNRVPIIMTCNDSGKFYIPLMRPGRTTVFHWNPDMETVKKIVSVLLNIDPSESNLLVNTLCDYANEIDSEKYRFGVPISTYYDIKVMLNDDFILQISQKYTLEELLKKTEYIKYGFQNTMDNTGKLEQMINLGKTLIHKDTRWV